MPGSPPNASLLLQLSAGRPARRHQVTDVWERYPRATPPLPSGTLAAPACTRRLSRNPLISSSPLIVRYHRTGLPAIGQQKLAWIWRLRPLAGPVCLRAPCPSHRLGHTARRLSRSSSRLATESGCASRAG